MRKPSQVNFLLLELGGGEKTGREGGEVREKGSVRCIAEALQMIEKRGATATMMRTASTKGRVVMKREDTYRRAESLLHTAISGRTSAGRAIIFLAASVRRQATRRGEAEEKSRRRSDKAGINRSLRLVF